MTFWADQSAFAKSKKMVTNQIIQSKGQGHYLPLVTNQNIQMKSQGQSKLIINNECMIAKYDPWATWPPPPPDHELPDLSSRQ